MNYMPLCIDKVEKVDKKYININQFSTNFDCKPSILLIAYRNKSRAMRNPAFCICENQGADQLCGNRTADQRLIQ